MIETIKRRYSVRTFKNIKINDLDLITIENSIKKYSEISGPFGYKINLHLINNTSQKQVGTYGIIKNAQFYIVGTCKNCEEALMDYGFIVESLVLDLFKVRIGSCWLGGTFKRTTFDKNIHINVGDIIPAVLPIGYPSDKRRIMENAMRALAKSDNKKPWGEIFFLNDFQTPLNELDKPKIKDLFEMVRLAPSASNKQPWRLVYNDVKNTVHVYLNEDPAYSGSKLGYSMQRIDIGIAISHLELTFSELKIDYEKYYINPNLQLKEKNIKYICSYNINS